MWVSIDCVTVEACGLMMCLPYCPGPPFQGTSCEE